MKKIGLSVINKHKYSCDVKSMIHDWIDLENKKLIQHINYSQKGNQVLHKQDQKIRSKDQTIHNKDQIIHKNDQTINKGDQTINKRDSKNKQMIEQKKNIYMEQQKYKMKQLIGYLYQKHPMLSRININLCKTIINIGEFKIHPKDSFLHQIFDPSKTPKLGLIIYGKLKLYIKNNNYQCFIDQNDSVGQHWLRTIKRDWNYIDVRVKVQQEVGMLWVQQDHYYVFYQQAIRIGLKDQVNRFQSHLNISHIRKRIPKFTK